jgi:hypothetical protein
MRIAKTLEAEWRQVLRGSVSTGAKEDESITGRVRAAGYYGPFSLGARFGTCDPFIYLMYKFFFGLR